MKLKILRRSSNYNWTKKTTITLKTEEQLAKWMEMYPKAVLLS
jgi:hypothetical protein